VPKPGLARDALTLRASSVQYRCRTTERCNEGADNGWAERRFLNTTYRAYHHRERPAEDEELARVGPGTACGEYLRRFWQPVIAVERIGRPAAARPHPWRGPLVAYRDKSGSIGLLELHCPHRGTSLEFGLIGDRGIRCCYHGWLSIATARFSRRPASRPTARSRTGLFHGAYPVHEYAGLVFAYMGPPDKQPAFPVLDTYDPAGLTG